ncbi:hypothetical protein E5259_26780 [Blautia producta]|uniref:Uncharacterized protein n=1 Tax=Blautia producta TaxID=33035 RepID=A0A7G5N200_9FIRM|nr:hypothetical protein E5259_26780 [Blautia producta]
MGYFSILGDDLGVQFSCGFNAARIGTANSDTHFADKTSKEYIMTFGLFLLALLTFVFTFCK